MACLQLSAKLANMDICARTHAGCWQRCGHEFFEGRISMELPTCIRPWEGVIPPADLTVFRLPFFASSSTLFPSLFPTEVLDISHSCARRPTSFGCRSLGVGVNQLVSSLSSMRRCYAPGCSNKPSETSNISYHKFPKDEAVRSSWIKAIGRPADWSPPSKATVCSRHFEPECY